MTSREFCYWLQGFFELQFAGQADKTGMGSLEPVQVDTIKRHLAMVFKHEIDPSYPNADELSHIHGDDIIRC